MTAPAAPTPVPVVLVAAAIELARRWAWLAGLLLLHPRTPALVARVLMVLPRAIVLAVFVIFAPYAIRGFFVVVLVLPDFLDTAGRFVADFLAYGIAL